MKGVWRQEELVVTWKVPWDLPLQSLNAPEIIMLQWLLSVLVGEEGQGLENQENREWERNGKGGSRNGRSEKMGSRRNRVELCNMMFNILH